MLKLAQLITARVLKEHGAQIKTSNRATDSKCKLMLTKSPESAHEKLELMLLIAPVFFLLSCKK